MIVSIGNAMVDALQESEEDIIEKLGLNKSRMTLVDEERSHFLLSNMDNPTSVSYTHLTLPTKA